MTSHQGATATAEHTTGMRDETYNIVSVLYHALQGGETCRQYLQDAQETGDQQLVQFFQDVQECHRHVATQAKTLLAHARVQLRGDPVRAPSKNLLIPRQLYIHF
jgi:hypothetical protein